MSDLDRLRLPVPGGLESAAVVPDTTEAARENLEAYVASDAFKGLPARVREVLEVQARAALTKLKEEKPLEVDDRIGLEALVRTTGRPALAVRGGTLDLNDPEAVPWKAELIAFLPLIERAVASIGRIDLNGAHVGTGFVVADDIVLTNRHVLEVIAKEFERPDGRRVWMLKAGEPTIDFIRESGAVTRRRFKIVDVVGAGPDATHGLVNFAHLDAALVRVAEKDDHDEALPQPLAMLKGDSLSASEPIAVLTIGFPGPARYAPVGPQPTAEEAEILAALRRIFAAEYGVKRVCPGKVLKPAGQVPGDAQGWIFSHDSTTLGGASGSAVIRMDGEDPVVAGLHFGGALKDANWAHLLPQIRPPLFDKADGVFRWSP